MTSEHVTHSSLPSHFHLIAPYSIKGRPSQIYRQYMYVYIHVYPLYHQWYTKRSCCTLQFMTFVWKQEGTYTYVNKLWNCLRYRQHITVINILMVSVPTVWLFVVSHVLSLKLQFTCTQYNNYSVCVPVVMLAVCYKSSKE